MRKPIAAYNPADFVIWSATFALGAVLGFGLAFGSLVRASVPAIGMLRVSEGCLAAGVLLIGAAVRPPGARLFLAGFALGAAIGALTRF